MTLDLDAMEAKCDANTSWAMENYKTNCGEETGGLIRAVCDLVMDMTRDQYALIARS